jgi:hypothetical protein
MKKLQFVSKYFSTHNGISCIIQNKTDKHSVIVDKDECKNNYDKQEGGASLYGFIKFNLTKEGERRKIIILSRDCIGF